MCLASKGKDPMFREAAREKFKAGLTSCSIGYGWAATANHLNSHPEVICQTVTKTDSLLVPTSGRGCDRRTLLKNEHPSCRDRRVNNAILQQVAQAVTHAEHEQVESLVATPWRFFASPRERVEIVRLPRDSFFSTFSFVFFHLKEVIRWTI